MSISYGQEIKNARKNKGLSQKQLAKTLEITQGLLSFYESDKQEPPMAIKNTLQNILGVKPQHTSKKHTDQQQKIIFEFVKLIEAIDPDKGIPKIEVTVIYE